MLLLTNLLIFNFPRLKFMNNKITILKEINIIVYNPV